MFTVVFLAILFACGYGAVSEFASDGQARRNPPKVVESELAHDVRHQLSVLPYYSVFDYITYTLEGSKVTLSGAVLRPTLRANAESAVKSLEGIITVENRIEVLPESTSDDDARRAAYRAIYEDTVLQKYGVSEVPAIHIIVKNGTLTLEGTVESESDKHLASARTANLPGISSAKNNLTVRSKSASGN